MSDRAAELGAALQNATDAPAILDALARAVWFNVHDGAECPDSHIPTPADLAAWLPACPAAARTEAADRMDRVAHVLMAAAPRSQPDWSLLPPPPPA